MGNIELIVYCCKIFSKVGNTIFHGIYIIQRSIKHIIEAQDKWSKLCISYVFEIWNNVWMKLRRLVCKNIDESPLDFTHDLNWATFAKW